MGSSSAPTFNANQAGKKQKRENRDVFQTNLQANRPNEYGPQATQTYTYDKQGNPTGVQRSLTGTAGAFDTASQDALQSYLQGAQQFQQPFNVDQQVRDRAYEMATRQLPAEEERQRNLLQSQLAAQGFDVTQSEAAQDAFRRQQEGFDANRNQFALDAERRAYDMALTDRQAGLQALGLYSPFVQYGGNVATAASRDPQFASVSQTPVNMAGLEQQQYQSQMDAYQQAQANQAGLFGGLSDFALGVATLPMGGAAGAPLSFGGNALMGLGKSLWGK